MTGLPILRRILPAEGNGNPQRDPQMRAFILCIVFMGVSTSIPASTKDGEWSPGDFRLKTPWSDLVGPENALPEYPRPQLAREKWMNLNGVWQYAQAQEGDEPPFGTDLPERILVPYPVESPLSGIQRLDTRMWYRRLFDFPSDWDEQRVHLHFGAVDWEAIVYLNGKALGLHRGGHDGFSFDVTDHLKDSGNELIVLASDETSRTQAKGKQSRTPNRYTYMASSGIWQTVWLEPTNDVFIENLRIVPDVDSSSVGLIVEAGAGAGAMFEAIISADGKEIARAYGNTGREARLLLENPRLWTPDDPYLYDVRVKLRRNGKVVDEVESYLGMRSIKLSYLDGEVRPLLNGRFVFQHGLLDQGYWPDGYYTAPTDAAYRYDIQKAKDLGFNLLRKHVKVEPARWYYWADRLGILVWQDMPHRGDVNPEDPSTLGRGMSLDELDALSSQPLGGNEQFELELREMVKERFHFPSIIQWVIFNEGWGIYDRDRLTDMVRRIDPFRLTSTQSGGEDKGGFLDTGSGDSRDHHTYGWEAARQVPDPNKTPNAFRLSAVGEYGGIETRVPGHMWGGFSLNREPEKLDELTRLYTEMQAKFDPHIPIRLSAIVYTQIVDTETEMNGLITYDRKVVKVDEEKVRAVNQAMIALGDEENALP